MVPRLASGAGGRQAYLNIAGEWYCRAATQLIVEAVEKVLSNVCLYRNGAADALILQGFAEFRMKILASGLFLQPRSRN